MTARARKKPLLVMPPLHCQIAGCGAEYATIGDYADTHRAAELGGWRYCIFDDDGRRLIGAWVCPDHRHVLPWWPGRRLALPMREPGSTRAEFLGVVPRAALPAAEDVSRSGHGAQGEPAKGIWQLADETARPGHTPDVGPAYVMDWATAPADVQTNLMVDPDCRDGKHPSCVGGPCECHCHAPLPQRTPAGPPAPDDRCDVDWGSATPSQRCTRDSGHHGVHIDEEGREFGYVPDDDDGDTRAHIMSSSPGRDDLPPLPQRKPAGPPGWQAAMDAELSPEALKREMPLEQLAPEQEDEAQP